MAFSQELPLGSYQTTLSAKKHSLADAEANLSVELDEEGVTIKADTVGGLEALAKELRAVEVPIRHASIGKVNRRDVRTAENSPIRFTESY